MINSIEWKKNVGGEGGVGFPLKFSIGRGNVKGLGGTLHFLHSFILYCRFRSTSVYLQAPSFNQSSYLKNKLDSLVFATFYTLS